MQPERAELYFQQGSSDKVYHLQLEGAQEQWSVQAQWGRRGSALQSDVKVSGTSYEEAKRVYDRILRRKQARAIKSPSRLQTATRQLRSDCLRQKTIPAIRRNC